MNQPDRTSQYGMDPEHLTDNRAVRSAGPDGHVNPAVEFLFDTSHAEGALALLRTTGAIRSRAAALLARARRGESAWFTIGDDASMDNVTREVVEVTLDRYPWEAIPLHSRWRHLQAGGIDRRAELDALMTQHNVPARTHAHIDLAVVSVLLDAGAGPDWRYVETSTGAQYTRSEGLAVASYHAFTSGLFSSDPADPLRVDAAALRALVTARLAETFQVSEANPLVGLEGRAMLLRRLGEALAEQPEVFGADGRPGGLFDMLVSPLGPVVPPTATIRAHDILSQLLMSLSHIWPSGNSIDSLAADGSDVLPGGDPAHALGDCWRHSAVEGPGLTRGWMPFHKLSQWLTYSLIEPFQWAGVQVEDIDALTALPEYRNGGLLVDCGVIVPRDAGLAARTWQVGDEFIVEWRALTIALLDEVVPRLHKHLARRDLSIPLASLLEGGTWAAGRATAQRLRGGAPPFIIESDGTVF